MVLFFAAILAISTLLYVLLDGFDLGVGIISGGARGDARRDAMMSAIAPIWDGNETWLVVTGVVLWSAFPLVYATLLPAFYLPLLLMLAGLILRGVAFEFRHRTERWRWLWDASFAGGSFVAAFVQGLTVGRLVEGLPIANNHYVGGDLGWLSPFAVLCGVGLCIGYSLLGACWLIRKCHGEVRELAYRLTPPLSLALLLFLIAVFGFALIEHLRVMNRWLERPYLFVFPAIGIVGAILLAASLQRRTILDHDRGCGRAAFEPGVHVLGRRPLRVPIDAALHGNQLQRVQRQDSAGRRSLPLITTEEAPQ